MKIDMGRKGPLGMELTIRNGIAYIGGTNHWLEWLHHFIPGAGWREVRWARQVLDAIYRSEQMVHSIAGHSVGGTVATIAAYLALQQENHVFHLYTYGAKRPPTRYNWIGKHYRIKGDVVPFLPPWRKGLPLITLDYGKMGPMEAHGPRSYYEQMRKDGVR